MKKQFCGILSLMIALGAFTACGNAAATASKPGEDQAAVSTPVESKATENKPAENKSASISFWKSPHSDHEEEIWKKVIAKFNVEHPEITVDFLAVPWDSVNQKEMAAFASNTPPDISFQVEQYPLYAKKDKLVDLNQYMTEEQKAGYPTSTLDYCTYDGKLMGRPFVALNSVMFYNKDIFEKEGIEVPKTWDEMIKAGQTCTKDLDGDGKIDQWGMLLVDKPNPSPWDAATYICQAGGDLWNADRTNIAFNNEAGVKGLQFYTDLYNKYKICPPLDTFSSAEEEKDLFYSGKAAMAPAQIQFIGNVRTSAPDLNVGIFLQPAGPGADKAHSEWAFSNIGMLSIAADSKYVEQAWQFLDFATQPEIEKDYLSEVGFFSPQLATNDLMYQDDPLMRIAAEGIANIQLSPATENFQGFFDGMQTAMESCLRGAATPQQAIQELEDKMTALAE